MRRCCRRRRSGRGWSGAETSRTLPSVKVAWYRLRSSRPRPVRAPPLAHPVKTPVCEPSEKMMLLNEGLLVSQTIVVGGEGGSTLEMTGGEGRSFPTAVARLQTNHHPSPEGEDRKGLCLVSHSLARNLQSLFSGCLATFSIIYVRTYLTELQHETCSNRAHKRSTTQQPVPYRQATNWVRD